MAIEKHHLVVDFGAESGRGIYGESIRNNAPQEDF